jgi:hypothetical protein
MRLEISCPSLPANNFPFFALAISMHAYIHRCVVENYSSAQIEIEQKVSEWSEEVEN